MKRTFLNIASLFVFAIFLCSCHHYKSLYRSCITDKTSLTKVNADLNSENTKIKADNSNLTKENESVKVENGQIKKANEDLLAENTTLKNQLDIAKKTKKFDLYFRQLCCDKTTEHGADEVYITILGSKIGSGDIYVRAPASKSHWDMNDGNQPTDNPSGDSHCLTNRTLFSGELKPGESYYLNVTVCEEDGGTTQVYQEIASEIAKKIPNPYVAGAGQILGVVTSLGGFIKDSDDWMGMFGVQVKNVDGVISVEWKAKERLKHLNPDPSYSTDNNRREIRMDGDGSNYVGWFGVRY